MFGDLMGDMVKKQEELKVKLAQVIVEENIDGIHITANAAREILNITIEDEAILQDKEQLEDLLVVAMNRINNKISENEVLESQKLLSDIMPSGLGNLFN
jgi:DNA-binding protein YbaB